MYESCQQHNWKEGGLVVLRVWQYGLFVIEAQDSNQSHIVRNHNESEPQSIIFMSEYNYNNTEKDGFSLFNLLLKIKFRLLFYLNWVVNLIKTIKIIEA